MPGSKDSCALEGTGCGATAGVPGLCELQAANIQSRAEQTNTHTQMYPSLLGLPELRGQQAGAEQRIDKFLCYVKRS